MHASVREQTAEIVQSTPSDEGGVLAFELERDGLWNPGNYDGIVELCVCRGSLWATLPGNATDYLLKEGERRQLRTSGLLVQALGDARFQARWL